MRKKTKRGQGRPTDVGAGEIRSRIISEAARIFADYGYAGASIQDIVDAAGTTKPMVYYYFKNKEGLFQEIFRAIREEIHQAQEPVAASAGATTREKLVALVDVHFQYTRRCPDHIRFMFAAHYGPRHEWICFCVVLLENRSRDGGRYWWLCMLNM